jgi:hypothetical protein
MLLALFLALVAACNLALLSAMAAGRAASRWGQGLLLAAEFVLLAAAMVLGILVGWTAGITNYWVDALALLVSFASAMAIGSALSYMEYTLLGARQNFRRDLRRSIWIGRGGTFRLAARDDHELTASAKRVKSALAGSNRSETAEALNDLVSELEALSSEGVNDAKTASVADVLREASKKLGGDAGT